MKRNLYVPIYYDLVRADTRGTYLAQLAAVGATHVFLALGREIFYANGKDRESAIENIAENVKFFKDNGYTVGVWTTSFGFGGPLSQKGAEIAKNYTRLRSVTGKEMTGEDAFCPEDKEFSSRYFDYVKDLCRSGCDLLMLDDEMCLSVRPGIGCFCKKHIALIEECLGESLEGKDLMSLFFTGAKNRYRDAWLSVMGETMRHFTKGVRAAIDEVDPSLRAGFCAGYTSWDIEGADALELTRILAGNNKPFLRFTGAPYWAAPISDRFDGQPLAAIIEETRAQEVLCRDSGVEVFTECDSYPRPRNLVPSSLLECFSLPLYASGGMGELLYIFDYRLTPAYETGYLRHRLYNRPLYEFIDRHFGDKSPLGVRVYHEMRKIEHSELDNGLTEKAIMRLHFNRGAELLGIHGIPTVYGEECECGIAFGEEARYIKKLPKRLVLDARAAMILKETGIDVGFSKIEAANAPGTETANGERYGLFPHSPDGYYKITLSGSAKAISSFNSDVGFPAAYRYKSGETELLVYAFDASKIPHRDSTLTSYLRGEQLFEFFGGVAHFDRTPGVYQLAKRRGDETALLIVNISQDPIIDGKLHLDGVYREAELSGAEGKLCGDVLQFTTLIAPYSACAVVLKK